EGQQSEKAGQVPGDDETADLCSAAYCGQGENFPRAHAGSGRESIMDGDGCPFHFPMAKLKRLDRRFGLSNLSLFEQDGGRKMVPRYLIDFDLTRLPSVETDVIIAGAGIAGLFTAIKASERNRVLLVTKKKLPDSNTRYAQGG